MKSMLVSSLDDLRQLFPTTVSAINTLAQKAYAEARDVLEELVAIADEERTFENTLFVLDDAWGEFRSVLMRIKTLSLACSDDALRNECVNVLRRLACQEVDLFTLNRGVYDALCSYREQEDAKKLDKQERYYLDSCIALLSRSGVALSCQHDRQQAVTLQKKIARLSLAFSESLDSDNSFITVAPDQLTGVSASFLAAASYDKQGRVIINCDYPSVAAVLDHCSNSEVRQRLYRAFFNRASDKNIKNLEQLIAARHDLAVLLGFKSYAHLSLTGEMAGDPAVALSFVNQIAARLQDRAGVVFDQMTDTLPLDVSLTSAGKLLASDVDYVAGCYRKKKFGIDHRKIAEYFPLEATVQGALSIYSDFMNVSFSCEKIDDLWHENLSLITVSSHDKREVLGYIILDLFPRPNKYTHCCQLDITRSVMRRDGSKNRSISVIMANLPAATDGCPPLLLHKDALIFFHEFGHAMHEILGRARLTGIAGTRVTRDFIEVPSQMLEEWMWDVDILQRISSHYKTGDCLPRDMIESLVAERDFLSISFLERQVCLARLSLAYYSGIHVDKEPGYSTQLWHEHHADAYRHVQCDTLCHGQCSFIHLTDYDARYYGYLWARVCSLDIFDVIKRAGLSDKAMAHNFVDKILKPGGSADPLQLLRSFLGRDPDKAAFFRYMKID